MKFIAKMVNGTPAESAPDNHVVMEAGDLLVTLKENLEKHTDEYKKAYEDYKKAYVSRLREIEKQFKKNPENAATVIQVRPPTDNSKVYLSVIERLKRSVLDFIALDAIEFNNYVMDDWSWKSDLSALTATYDAVLKKR